MTAFFLPALALAATQPAPQVALSCVVVGRDDARARFELDLGEADGQRRVGLRAESGAPWLSQLTAASHGGARPDGVHFVAGGVRYWMSLALAGEPGSRTAVVKIEENRYGNHGLNREVAQGSCRERAEGSSPVFAALPAVPDLPAAELEIRPFGPEVAYVTPCTLVRPDLSEFSFDLRVRLAPGGTWIEIDPVAGQSWPAQRIHLDGAMLAAQARLRSDPGVAEVTSFVAAGHGAASTLSVDYVAGGSETDQAGWITLYGPGGAAMGAGYCRMGHPPAAARGASE